MLHFASGPALEIDMSTQESTVEAVRGMTNKEIVLAILELQRQVAELQRQVAELTKVRSVAKSDREMTDDDARRVLTGDLASAKHKDAAEQLGLSYGQIYSCRLGYTFKHIHKEMHEKGQSNPWKK